VRQLCRHLSFFLVRTDLSHPKREQDCPNGAIAPKKRKTRRRGGDHYPQGNRTRERRSLTALRLCLDRIAPPRKDRPVLFGLPPVSSAADAAKAAAGLLEAVAVGDLTPAEASELGKLIDAYIKALEATDFAERLDKLERMTNR
jgi:hypothetical protein